MTVPDDPKGKATKPPAPVAEPAETGQGAGQDVVLLHSRTEDGQGVRALRARSGGEGLEVAEIRPLQQGKPLQGTEVVRLRPRQGLPFVCDVDVQYDGRAAEEGEPGQTSTGQTSSGTGQTSSGGPAQVASTRYRRNWERVFGRRKRRKLPPIDDSNLN